MQGLHLTADLQDCGCAQGLLTHTATLAAACRHQTELSGLTLVGETWHRFPDVGGRPGGVTGVLLLAESHLAVHTWPELRAVTLDVYVCNFTGDNSARARRLMDALHQVFGPGRTQRGEIRRGVP